MRDSASKIRLRAVEEDTQREPMGSYPLPHNCMSTHVRAHPHAQLHPQLHAHILPIGSASPYKKRSCDESVAAERSFPAQLREAESEHPPTPTLAEALRHIKLMMGT